MTDWSKGAAWIRGEVVPLAEATIGVTDWGLTRSDITYDVVPVWDGGFFRLEDYLDRFAASMASLRLDVGVSREEIRAALHAMVAYSGLRRAYVAMVASRGVPLIPGTRDPRACANHFYAWCVPYVHVIAPEIGQVEGVALVRVFGGRDRRLEIELDEAQMGALGLDPVPGAARIEAALRRASGGAAAVATTRASKRSAISWAMGIERAVASEQ